MRPRVLVVDDDPDIRASLRMVLDDYEVVGACDGLEALEYVGAGGVDVIVLDLMMPTMDGATFLRELRARGISLPIIVSSAATGLSERVRELGVSIYLPKPFDIDQLEALLIEALSKPRAASGA
jgi:two-component system response regulator MprA